MDMDDGGAGLIDRDGVLDDLIHSDGEGRKFLLAGDGARQGTGDNYWFSLLKKLWIKNGCLVAYRTRKQTEITMPDTMAKVKQ